MKGSIYFFVEALRANDRRPTTSKSVYSPEKRQLFSVYPQPVSLARYLQKLATSW